MNQWSVQAFQAGSNVLQRALYFPETYGADPTGTFDSYAAMQACLNAAAGHGTVYLSGRYIITTPKALLMPANTNIYRAAGSSLLRNWIGNAGGTQALLVSGDGTLTSKANNIVIAGPGTLGATSLLMLGNIVSVYGDHFHFGGGAITTWAQGRAIVGAGDYWRGWDETITGSDQLIHSGGIRPLGGRGGRIFGCHVESGDDCLQFVPSGNTTDPLFNQSLYDYYYIGCTAISFGARGFSCLLSSPTLNSMTCTIQNVGWTDCDVYGNVRSCIIMNTDSSTPYAIDGVKIVGGSGDAQNSQIEVLQGDLTLNQPQIQNIGAGTQGLNQGMNVAGAFIPGGTKILSVDSGTQITMTNNATNNATQENITFSGFPQSFLILANLVFNPNAGLVRNITITEHAVRNPVGTNQTVFCGNAEDVKFDNCTIPGSPNAQTDIVNFGNTVSPRFTDGVIDALGLNLNGITGGGSIPGIDGCQDFRVKGTRVKNLMNTQIAVNANLVSGGSIKEVRAEPFAGQTTVHGWRTGASTTGMLVWDNDWTQLANGGLFTDLAADTIQGNNRV